MSNELPKPGHKLNIKKLKDPEVVLHPTISKWRDAYVFDPLLYNSLGEGQVQPIVFRKLGDKFELLAGSRRYFHQKLRKVSFDDLYKDVRENVSDRDALLLAASENIFREDFTPWEEARVINDLLMVGKMKVKEVAEHLGKSEAYVTNRRALLSLPEKVQARFEKKNIPIGYAVPVRRLSKFPEARTELINKLVEGMSGGYSSISTIEKADQWSTNFIDAINEKEALLKAYGPCPKCESKDIELSRHGDENRLSCGACGHRWHKDTKEPWKLYELKQQAQAMGFDVDVDEKMTLTPKDVVDIAERRDRIQREAEEEEAKVWAEKFRSPILIEEIIMPLLPGNTQKVTVQGNNIEIELIEDSGLYFKGLKKDYQAGEKGRIEITYGYGSQTQETAEKVHTIIKDLTTASES